MIFKMGNLKLSLKTNSAYIKNKELELRPMEYEVLRALAVNSSNYLSPSKINAILGLRQNSRVVFLYISSLRKKIKPLKIENVFGVGYKLVNGIDIVRPYNFKQGHSNPRYVKISKKNAILLKRDLDLSLKLLARKYNVDIQVIKSLWGTND